jgi:hypothetical protein
MRIEKLSANKAAAQERACWMRKLARLRRRVESGEIAPADALRYLAEWGRDRTKRTAKRPGGLGRK